MNLTRSGSLDQSMKINANEWQLSSPESDFADSFISNFAEFHFIHSAWSFDIPRTKASNFLASKMSIRSSFHQYHGSHESSSWMHPWSEDMRYTDEDLIQLRSGFARNDIEQLSKTNSDPVLEFCHYYISIYYAYIPPSYAELSRRLHIWCRPYLRPLPSTRPTLVH
jgi:hypothetical protein